MTSPPTGGIEVPVVKFVLFFFGKDKTIFDSRLDREPIEAYNLCLFFLMQSPNGCLINTT